MSAGWRRTGPPTSAGWLAVAAWPGLPGFDLPPHVVTGSPDKIAERVRALVASGVTHVQPRVMARSATEYADQVEAFGQQVIPLVNG